MLSDLVSSELPSPEVVDPSSERAKNNESNHRAKALGLDSMKERLEPKYRGSENTAKKQNDNGPHPWRPNASIMQWV